MGSLLGEGFPVRCTGCWEVDCDEVLCSVGCIVGGVCCVECGNPALGVQQALKLGESLELPLGLPAR